MSKSNQANTRSSSSELSTEQATKFANIQLNAIREILFHEGEHSYIPLTERYLSTEQASIILNTNPQNLRSARSSGLLFGRKAPPYRKLGTKKIAYDAIDLIAWVEEAPLIIVTTEAEPAQLRAKREGALS